MYLDLLVDFLIKEKSYDLRNVNALLLKLTPPQLPLDSEEICDLLDFCAYYNRKE